MTRSWLTIALGVSILVAVIVVEDCLPRIRPVAPPATPIVVTVLVLATPDPVPIPAGPATTRTKVPTMTRIPLMEQTPTTREPLSTPLPTATAAPAPTDTPVLPTHTPQPPATMRQRG